MDKFSENWVNQLIEKALYFSERYESDLIKGELPKDIDVKELMVWERSLGGAPGSIKRRLKLFAEQVFDQDDAWKGILIEILTTYNWDTERNQKFHIDLKGFIAPFTHWLSNQIYANIRTYELWDEKFINSYLNYCNESLLHLSEDCIYEFVSNWRINNHSSSPADFNQYLMDKSYKDFYLTYAALSRSLCEQTISWFEKLQFLLDAFQEDYDQITKVFSSGQKLILTDIQILSFTGHRSLGHNSLLIFQNGLRLLYKPKSGLGDKIYNDICTWYNYQRSDITLRNYEVIDQVKYSWSEFIEDHKVNDIIDVEWFYKSLGVLQAIFHVLGSRDYHFENIIAHGKFPVATDHESILSSIDERILIKNPFGDKQMSETLLESITISGLTSTYLSTVYMNPPSIDSLFFNEDEFEDFDYALDKDGWIRKILIKQKRIGKNFPTDDRFLSPENLQWVHSGYKECLQIIKESLEDFKSLVYKNITDLDSRLLLRPSGFYARIIREGLSAKNFKNGIMRSLYFERLAGFYLSQQEFETDHFFLQKEINQLLRFEIPKFHISSSNCDLVGTDLIVQAKSPIDSFIERLEMLSSPNQDIVWFDQMNILTHRNAFGYSNLSSLLYDMILKLSQSIQLFWKDDFSSDTDLLEYYDLNRGNGGLVLLFCAAFDQYQEEAFLNTAQHILNPLLSILKSINPKGCHLSYVHKCSDLGLPIPIQLLSEISSEEIYPAEVEGTKDLKFSQLFKELQNRSSDTIIQGKAYVIEDLINLNLTISQKAEIETYLLNRMSGVFKFDLGENYHDLGFYRGLSGILYQYLRFISDGSVPSLLK